MKKSLKKCLLDGVAVAIEKIAVLKTNQKCVGLMYEPSVPRELVNKEKITKHD